MWMAIPFLAFGSPAPHTVLSPCREEGKRRGRKRENISVSQTIDDDWVTRPLWSLSLSLVCHMASIETVNKKNNTKVREALGEVCERSQLAHLVGIRRPREGVCEVIRRQRFERNMDNWRTDSIEPRPLVRLSGSSEGRAWQLLTVEPVGTHLRVVLSTKMVQMSQKYIYINFSEHLLAP